MNNKKIKMAVVTAYYPNPYNEGGGPTGLLWEMLDFLSKTFEIEIFKVELPKNIIMKVVRRNGIYLSSFDKPLDKYDIVLTYPDDMIFYLPKKYWNKVIILGPDAPAFRDARYLRMKKTCFEKVIKYIMYNIALYNEYRALKYIKKYIVVGNTDARYMKRNNLLNDELRNKIIYMRHPILNNVISDKIEIKKYKEKQFIFSITPKKHNEDFMYSLFDELRRYSCGDYKKINIKLIGDRSKWMYDILQDIPCCNVEYINWVDKYKDVCIPGRDVHCMSITAGSGTKNRTLTAIASGLEVITTPIGIENIPWGKRCGIYITNSPQKFAQYMIKINSNELQIDKSELIEERREIINKINCDYYRDMKKIFMES